MNPVLQQAVTIAGVLLGALASFAATTVTERTRWRRAHTTRWDDKRLTAYTDYANAIKSAATVCFRLASTRGFPAGGMPIDLKAGLAELGSAERDRGTKWEAVLLLGNPAVAAAARTWHECLWKLEWLARGHEATEEEFVAMTKDYRKARADFYARARADLGVTSGDLPAPGPRRDLRWAPLADEGGGEVAENPPPAP